MATSCIVRLLALAFGTCAAAFAQPVDHPYGRSQPIAGRYIVVFKAHVANPAAEAANLTRGAGGQLHHTYASAIKGFAASLPDSALQALRNNPNVDYVEQDQTVSLNDADTGTTQMGATWGLDRIDQRTLSLNSDYHYHYTGALSPSGRVNAFIIDTGIKGDHVEFTGRLIEGRNFVDGANDTNTGDCNGHGTHVAGTVGGTTWGVAKGVSLIPVRVLDCAGSGTWSGVIAGIDWAATQASRLDNPLKPAVANLSLGGGASSSVDTAVAGAVNKGVTVVVAAGNSNADACKYSPARAPSAITVGATTSADTRASYSNYGTCLDIFAPGSSITSASISSTTAGTVKSGTSMASPHVAGVAALALAANKDASPWAVASFLTTNATTDALSSVGAGSLNLLIYSLAAGSPVEPPQQTVAVMFMSGNATAYGKGWRASATVTIAARNQANWGNAVSGATVVGSFSPGGTASCVTDANGSCTLTSATINKLQTKLTVNNVSGPLMTYEPTSNAVTQITITKP